MEVVVPPGQGCCGALALHAGRAGEGAAPCRAPGGGVPDRRGRGRDDRGWLGGSAMKEYGALFAAAPRAAAAAAFASRVRDVSEVLDELGIVAPLQIAIAAHDLYHDACHLSHAQHVRSAPRLAAWRRSATSRCVSWRMPRFAVSAGLYNQQRGVAGTLGAQKAAAVIATGADALVTGTLGPHGPD